MSRYHAALAIGLLTTPVPVYAAESGASPNPMRALGKGDLKAFVELPLFNPMRRLPSDFAPVAIPLAIPTAAVDPPPNVKLLGVVQGGKDVVLVRGPDNGTLMLSNGEKFGGWDVVVRPPNGLRLTKGTRAYDYAIFATVGGGGPLAVESEAPAVGAGGHDR